MNLRIATWNANGIIPHILELEIFLRKEKIDICLISETHTTKQSYIKINEYDCYHTPHPSNKARGGTAVLIRKNISHNEEHKIEETIMQVTTVSIHTKNKEIKISAIYCPPRHTPLKEDYLKLFKILGNNFIIGGDYNAKHTYWGSRLITQKGRELYRAGKEYRCEFLSAGTPTYWPTDPEKTPDIIDFFISKGITSKYAYLEGNDDLSSDHSPVILTLSETIIQEENNPRLTNKKTDWTMFREVLQSFVNLSSPLETEEQIDRETEQFMADIQQAAEESTPAVTQKSKQRISYPMEVKKLIQDKRSARRKWQQTRFPGDKSKFNRLSNKLKRYLKEIKNKTINKFLSNLTADSNTDYSLWKAVKRLKRPQKQNPPLKTANGTWAKNSKQKANLFAVHLENVFKPHPKCCDDPHINNVHEGKEEVQINFVTMKELKNLIENNLNAKKAPGYDLITGKIIKELPDIALQKLQYIINACFKARYMPWHWKIAEVILIPKPGKPPTEVTSYRPISLLPIMSKLFERLLLKRLMVIIKNKKLIPTHQFGFRTNHSTIEQVHRITNLIEKTLEEGKVCSAIFLDVAQAFDKVWHKGLDIKLQRDLPKQYYQMLKSYLTDRHFRVRFGNQYSNLKKITAGVPQGSVLGPILYLLYTRDIPQMNLVLLGTFADDTAMLAAGRDVESATYKLQSAVDKVSVWMKEWRIALNETKSTHINFTYKRITPIPIRLNGVAIPYSNTAKYLGMTLDVKLKWKAHVKIKKEELKIKYNKLYWLLGRNSELSVTNKLLIYKQVLKPVWTYGIQLWGCTKTTNVKPIQTFQNKVLRGVVNAPWYIRNSDLHRDLNINLVTDEIKRYAGKHTKRLEGHENPEMRAVSNERVSMRRLMRTKPYELAF